MCVNLIDLRSLHMSERRACLTRPHGIIIANYVSFGLVRMVSLSLSPYYKWKCQCRHFDKILSIVSVVDFHRGVSTYNGYTQHTFLWKYEKSINSFTKSVI